MKLNLENKKILMEKMMLFGFKQSGDEYLYSTDIVNGQFTVELSAARDSTISTRVTDKTSGDEYVLHLMDSAQGSFVGRVREEYNAVIKRVIDECCENDVFKTDYAKKLIKYVRNTYGDELEYLWEKFSDNAIWRRKDNKKWYAALLTVSKRKLGLDSDEIVEIVDLRMMPEEVVSRVDNKTYFPGWHMNKKNWITIMLDGSVDFCEICHRVNESYLIAGK